MISVGCLSLAIKPTFACGTISLIILVRIRLSQVPSSDCSNVVLGDARMVCGEFSLSQHYTSRTGCTALTLLLDTRCILYPHYEIELHQGFQYEKTRFKTLPLSWLQLSVSMRTSKFFLLSCLPDSP